MSYDQNSIVSEKILIRFITIRIIKNKIHAYMNVYKNE